MKKSRDFIKNNLLEIYTIVVLFFGVPIAVSLFWGLKAAFAAFVLIQIPVLLLAVRKG